MILRDYSFIANATDKMTFQMHVLIQLATRTCLQLMDNLKVEAKIYHHIMCRISRRRI
ncbi:hypothetical protein BDW75DRAFT_221947 [Aspergillus navahoensis]